MSIKNFKKKDHAIKIIQESDNSNLHIFANDLVKNKGCKSYLVTDYKTIYTTIIKANHSHYYEYYLTNQPIKLMLDLDIKSNKNAFKFTFDEIIKLAIDPIKIKLKQITDLIPEIIILESCTDIKKSAHIVFSNIVFH